jgi:hypothetical protein
MHGRMIDRQATLRGRPWAVIAGDDQQGGQRGAQAAAGGSRSAAEAAPEAPGPGHRPAHLVVSFQYLSTI